MPYFARVLIALCVGVPAVLARMGGVLWACNAGILLLVDPETLSIVFGSHTGAGMASPVLFVIALALSVIGYLVEVGVAYINSEQRQAVPPRQVAVLIMVELAVQLLGVAAACLSIAAVFKQPATPPWAHPAAIVAGAICGLTALFLAIRYRRRTNDWRAIWKAPASGGLNLTK